MVLRERRLLPTTLPLRHPSSSLIFRVNSQRAAAHVTSPLDPNSRQELALLRSSDLRSVGVHKTLSALLITDTCLRALRRYAPPVEGEISPASKQRLLPARRQAFLHAILRGFTRHQAHTFDCHATVVPSGLQPQAPGMCLQAASAMPMICHRQLHFLDKRLILTRAWYLIAQVLPTAFSAQEPGTEQPQPRSSGSTSQAPRSLHPPTTILAPGGQLGHQRPSSSYLLRPKSHPRRLHDWELGRSAPR